MHLDKEGVIMKHDSNNCPIKTRMDRFLEVCLLIILSEKSGYGYDIMNDLEEYGFSSEELNIGSLYRVLRRMEHDGRLISKWQESTLGPDKRIYEISDKGVRDLSEWIKMLEQRIKKIDFVISKYNHLKKDSEKKTL